MGSIAPVPFESSSGFTFRAVFAGCAIGSILSAGNVYTGLKTSYVDGGSITAAVLGFALLARKSGHSARPYSVAENNLTQTISSSAAVMSVVTGLTAPIAALTMSGHTYPYWVIALWGMAVGTIGIAIARLLRQRLIVTDDLPFPSGRATGEIIETMHARGSSDGHRAAFLLAAAAVAAIVTWFRDGIPAVVPQALTLPFGHAALTAAGLWLGAAVSPVMFSAGVLIGPRGGTSVLAGTVIAWGFLAPIVLAKQWAAQADYSAVGGWLLWPGVALLVSSAVTALLMDWRSVVRGARDLANLGRGKGGDGDGSGSRFWTIATAASVVATAAIAWGCFDVHPAVMLPARAFAFVMSGGCAGAAGETDLAPGGSAGARGHIL
ncbi:MAG: OPT/YSL family transporter, partial [Polyangiaceae bacterium]